MTKGGLGIATENLDLSQVEKLLETIPILSLTFDEKRKLMKLIEKRDKKRCSRVYNEKKF